MHYNFEAKEVSYTEAIGGEIVQVSLDQDSSEHYNERTKLYLLLSTNYEFPPITVSAEWHDGNDYGGGAEVTKYTIDKDSLQVWLNNGLTFDIRFETDEMTFHKIKSYLKNTVS